MATQKDSTTPLMRQYNEIKAKFPDTIVLYRIGDFYETFGEDAVQTSKILDIVLTRRAGGGQDKLAGFPYHSLETYLPKFVKAGKRVAICDQVEDPKQSKGIVKRAITEVVTPGISSIGGLISNQNNYLCCVTHKKENYGIAFIDITTGDFSVSQGNKEDINKLLKDFQPKEIILNRNWEREFKEIFNLNTLTKVYDDWVFTFSFAQDTINEIFGVNSLKGFGIENMPLASIAASACLHYIKETNHNELYHICNISRIDNGKYVWLDNFTISNLELIDSNDVKNNSLYSVINKTQSAMGARLLHKWLLLPLKDIADIEKRQNIVSTLLYEDKAREEIISYIRSIGDMERMISKISFKRIQPNELYSFAYVLDNVGKLKEELTKLNIVNEIEEHSKLKDFIFNAIDKDAPNNINKQGAIRQGFNAQLDSFRAVVFDTQNLLNNIKDRESQQTGINNLKIGFNNVFGYYIEVTNSNKDKVPASWQRKQTLANCERYVTQELKELEAKILTAQENISNIETSIYYNVLDEIIPHLALLQHSATEIARIDCLTCFSIIAKENNYTKPQILDSDILYISKGRHPVIEKMLKENQEYIANDVYLDTTTQQIVILTGPNMSGKSAYLRQTALIVLMAQMGSYVPAQDARIGIVDKIFTRVGASDNISSGESTFMVEMNETASILNNLSSHSLILLDEIGRGTSTYDGVSIAWAVAAYLHDNKYKAKVLFATHYHELIAMQDSYPRIKNYHIQVKEIGQRIIFLHTIAQGGSSKSFGIHVAKLAGIPKQVLSMADKMLSSLEESHNDSIQLNIDEQENAQKISLKQEKKAKKEAQIGFQTSFIQLNDPILEDIKIDLLNLDIDNLTPIEALNHLSKIKNMIKNI